jgi:hypothetical protein
MTLPAKQSGKIRTGRLFAATRAMEVMVFEEIGTLYVRRSRWDREVLMFFNLSENEIQIPHTANNGEWTTILDSDEPARGGRGRNVPLRMHGQDISRFVLKPGAVIILEKANSHAE